MNPLAVIKQENTFGCSVACVAGLLGITYLQARNLFSGGEHQAEVKGFKCQEIVDTLAKINVESYYKYLEAEPKFRRKIYNKGTIVCIQKNKRFPYGHYLLRMDGGWMDSWMNYPTDKDLNNGKAGFRKRLPGKPLYAVFVKGIE